MRIWLTGAQGQIGGTIHQHFAQHQEHQLWASTRHDVDITQRDAVWQAAAHFRPDVIINAAAFSDVDNAETQEQEAMAVNADGTAYLAEAAQHHRVTFIHFSSDYVFDGESIAPYRENDETNPLNLYGKSKLAGEHAALNHCERTLIIRTSWVFGGQGKNFVRSILRAAQQRGHVDVVSDCFGAPTYAPDIAAAVGTLLTYLQKPEYLMPYGIYHFSGAPMVTWFEFARAVFRQAAIQNILSEFPTVRPISAQDYACAATRPRHSRLNCRKIQHTFGIVPSDWQRALTQLNQYYP